MRRFWAKVVDLKRCLCERMVDSRVEMSVSDGVVSEVDKVEFGGSDSRLEGFLLRLRLRFVTVVQMLLLFMVWVQAFWILICGNGALNEDFVEWLLRHYG